MEGKKEVAATSEALAAHQSFEAIVGGEGSDDDSTCPWLAFPVRWTWRTTPWRLRGFPRLMKNWFLSHELERLESLQTVGGQACEQMAGRWQGRSGCVASWLGCWQRGKQREGSCDLLLPSPLRQLRRLPPNDVLAQPAAITRGWHRSRHWWDDRPGHQEHPGQAQLSCAAESCHRV